MTATNPHQQAIDHMQHGRFDDARRLLEDALSEQPHDARALRLLGTVCHLSGRDDEAVDLLERALAADPASTSTLVNLGGVYLDRARLDDARRCFDRVVELTPESPDGHFGLGLAAQRAGQLEDAERHYRDALSRDQDALDARLNLATVQIERDRPEDAANEASRVLERDAANAGAHQLVLESLLRLGRTTDAERALERARSHDIGGATFQSLAGELHARCGRMDTAIDSYRSAIASGDRRVRTALALARCELESGLATDAADTLRASIEHRPDAAECHALLALALDETDEHELALAAARRAEELQPASADYITLHARLLHSLDRDDEAEQQIERAIRASPMSPAAHLLRVERCIERNDLNAALAACNAYLEHGQHECSLLATKGFLLYALGHDAEGARLLDYDRLIQAWVVTPPQGDDALARFNAELARAVQAHPSLSHYNAAGKATQGGRQSGDLLSSDEEPFASLRSMLWQAAKHYAAKVEDVLEQDPAHPFLGNAPRLGSLHGWGVVLERAGYQSPHIHPTAWLSGVYYPQLPVEVREGSSEQGWIEFGAPPPELTFERRAPTRRLRPQEGLIVLFPSYFYHRTVPYESDEQRVSVAFDFSPQRPGATPT